ncbi:unnamed protein product [Timema podura]|uniref:Uncharacterized protein n=1 Tax=Timema podura TaxID=61482 RepID=A0ABN7NSK9_TIMPD|nr:unnamed protein product [Timema podura]
MFGCEGPMSTESSTTVIEDDGCFIHNSTSLDPITFTKACKEKGTSTDIIPSDHEDENEAVIVPARNTKRKMDKIEGGCIASRLDFGQLQAAMKMLSG